MSNNPETQLCTSFPLRSITTQPNHTRSSRPNPPLLERTRIQHRARMFQVTDNLFNQVHKNMIIMFNRLIERMVRSLQDTEFIICLLSATKIKINIKQRGKGREKGEQRRTYQIAH